MGENVPVYVNFGMVIEYPKNIRGDNDIRCIMDEMFIRKDYDDLNMRGKVVYDVGAYCGETAIFFSKYKGAQHVYAIEPYNSYSLIAHNCENNEVDNVDAIRGAIGPATSTTLIDGRFNNNGGTVYGSDETWGKTEIPMFSLEDFVHLWDKNPESRHNVLKMDVEGMEFEVIPSCSPRTLRLFDAIFMEYHWHNGFTGADKGATPIVRALRDAGFGIELRHVSENAGTGLIYARKVIV